MRTNELFMGQELPHIASELMDKEELNKMEEQKNLTENVGQLRIYKQDHKTPGDAPDTITIVKEIQREIESLERKIDLIFGGHVLLNGKFVNYDKVKEV